MTPHTTLHDPLLAENKPTYFQYKGPKSFKQAVSVARHYGFHLTEPIETTSKYEKHAQNHQGKRKREKTGQWYIHLADKLSELEAYIENMRGWPQPAMICHTKHPRRQVGQVHLSSFGGQNEVTEGLIIATALAILKELGYEDLKVSVNCIGGKKSREKFIQSFKDHMQNHLSDMRPTCRQKFKEDPLSITTCLDDTCSEIMLSGPQPVSHLRKADRIHLKEICEYLEALSIPYEINPRLTGSAHHHTRSAFHIKKAKGDGTVLARGERHQHTPGKMDYNRSLHTTSASVDVPGGRRESYKSVDNEDVQKPRVYHLHLGHDARKYSLSILEEMREAGISVLQTLSEDKLREQIRMAEEMKTPFAVLVGLKEAQEGTAIVRNLRNHAQETVPRQKLASYLKANVV